jgi:hypothetical protein
MGKFKTAKNTNVRCLMFLLVIGFMIAFTACASSDGASLNDAPSENMNRNVFLKAALCSSQTGGTIYSFELEEDGTFTVTKGSGSVIDLDKNNILEKIQISVKLKLSDSELSNLNDLASEIFEQEKIYPTMTVISEGPMSLVFYKDENRNSIQNPEIVPLIDEFIRISPLSVGFYSSWAMGLR